VRVENPRTGVETQSDMPLRLALRPIAPNPAVASAHVRFDLPKRTHVRIRVFDVAGREVTSLVDAARSAGRHSLVWAGRDREGRAIPAGIYFVRMDAGGETQIQKAVITR